MSWVETRAFTEPGETMELERLRAERVDAGGVRVWRYTFAPGWRFTEHFDAEGWPSPHAAYIAAGRLRVVMEDGTEVEGGPGEVMVIAPGHDAWTVGDEPCVFIDFEERLAAGWHSGTRGP